MMRRYLLEVHQVEKSFQEVSGIRSVLQGVDLTISEGTMVGLVGLNGSGKSTLLGIISGKVDPDEGRVVLEGVNISHLSREKRARSIGIVEQDTYKTLAARLTVAELLALASKRQRRLRVRKLGIDDAFGIIRRYSQVVGEFLSSRSESPTRELSGGQRQLLALAAAVVGHPRLLLLDEHIASLDAEFMRASDELLESLVSDQGTAILAVAHDMKWIAKRCNPIYRLRDGYTCMIEANFLKETIDAPD